MPAREVSKSSSKEASVRDDVVGGPESEEEASRLSAADIR
jgi:hypothetical protein